MDGWMGISKIRKNAGGKQGFYGMMTRTSQHVFLRTQSINQGRGWWTDGGGGVLVRT